MRPFAHAPRPTGKRCSPAGVARVQSQPEAMLSKRTDLNPRLFSARGNCRPSNARRTPSFPGTGVFYVLFYDPPQLRAVRFCLHIFHPDQLPVEVPVKPVLLIEDIGGTSAHAGGNAAGCIAGRR